MNDELNSFINGWQSGNPQMKLAFLQYRDFLAQLPDTTLDFRARPGISYSLRAKNSRQQKRDLFVLVDVVDDEPDNRWLSVCFYADMVTDPDEQGDFVPSGLIGEDAVCFNLDETSPDMQAYIGDRIREASQNAAK